MAYYNRKEQTLRTLDGFEKQYAGKYDFEVIIVDDNSNDENKLDEDINKYSFPINLIVITAEEKGDRINPCVAYNRGFKEAKGNIIMIQNPECYHLDNILHDSITNIQINIIRTYTCFGLNSFNQNNLDHTMCKDLININWNGELFDCDFNQALQIPLSSSHLSSILLFI